MVKYQNRGQGTLSAIMSLVIVFLVIDLVIAVLILSGVNVTDFFGKTDDNTNVSITTDNTGNTDNTGMTDNN